MLLEESIVSSVRNLIGESPMKALLFHLHLDKVAKDPKMFHESLHSLLKEPAMIIELMIVKDLFSRLNMQFQEKGPFEFQRYTRIAKEAFLARERYRGS